MVATPVKSFSAFLLIMEVYGNIYKSPPLYHSVSQFNPIYLEPYLFKCIVILYLHLWIYLEWCSLLSGFLAKILYEFLMSNMCSTCQSVTLFLITLLQKYFEKYADVSTHCHYILKSIVDINYRPHEKCWTHQNQYVSSAWSFNISQPTTLLLRNEEVLGSNLGPETGYSN